MDQPITAPTYPSMIGHIGVTARYRSWLPGLTFYPGYEVTVGDGYLASAATPYDQPVLRVAVTTTDSTTGEPATITHQLPLPTHIATREAFKDWIGGLLAGVAVHESMEFFRDEGRPVHDAHPSPTEVRYHMPVPAWTPTW